MNADFLREFDSKFLESNSAINIKELTRHVRDQHNSEYLVSMLLQALLKQLEIEPDLTQAHDFWSDLQDFVQALQEYSQAAWAEYESSKDTALISWPHQVLDRNFQQDLLSSLLSLASNDLHRPCWVDLVEPQKTTAITHVKYCLTPLEYVKHYKSQLSEEMMKVTPSLRVIYKECAAQEEVLCSLVAQQTLTRHLSFSDVSHQQSCASAVKKKSETS